MSKRKAYPHVTATRTRHGKPRLRYRNRKNGISCDLPGPLGSKVFLEAYDRAERGIHPGKPLQQTRAQPGTFDALMEAYRASPKYRNLADITRRNLAREMEWLSRQIGDLPYAQFAVRHVEAVMAKKDGPSAANKIKKLLSRLFTFAIKNELATHNPARHAERYKENPDGYHTMTAAEQAQFLAYHPEGSMARRALVMMKNTAAARQDIARMGWQNIDGTKIRYRRGKTGVDAEFPILPETAAELAHVPPDQLLFFTHSGGKPYAAESFGNWFKAQCKAAGLPHCNIHSVRKATATELAESGANQEWIAAVLAHSNSRQASTYTKKAGRSRMVEDAFSRRKPPENVSHLGEKWDNRPTKHLKDKG